MTYKYFVLEKLPENVNCYIYYRFLKSNNANITNRYFPTPPKLSNETIIKSVINTSLASLYKYVQTARPDVPSTHGAINYSDMSLAKVSFHCREPLSEAKLMVCKF